ncbi:hypothetical protein [Cellulomonas fengjieae]|uniref:Nuclear transport factor 2 family protein n=1 Tax=Cellulomonas fengjieae TaxID=2819978 RepID=A0ABS3SIF0_9CELL|nr:hypothetical protein [Cellulomonas fengjieae]MBO3085526.1 hypothetical protein [Cellulomonas fengjieae]MBO3102634.1 hypothetical protein [Cellulomonas fengjieae]QVI64432.1 hypothetical protein KG102_09425 [Cellulomonas fengjieae]
MTRLLSIAVLVLGAVSLGACSPDAEPSVTEPSSTTATPTPTPTETVVDDEAAVQAAFDRYWAAEVEAQRGNPDPALFVGVAEGTMVEDSLAIARDFQANGLVREGAPTFSGQLMDVQGDAATVLVCVDNSTWTVAGQTVEPGISLVQPNGLSFARRGEAWVVTEAFVPPAEYTC